MEVEFAGEIDEKEMLHGSIVGFPGRIGVVVLSIQRHNRGDTAEEEPFGKKIGQPRFIKLSVSLFTIFENLIMINCGLRINEFSADMYRTSPKSGYKFGELEKHGPSPTTDVFSAGSWLFFTMGSGCFYHGIY